MMAGRGSSEGAAGGPARHIPVLLAEVVESLRIRSEGVYLDGTFGAGGYTRAILAADPSVKVLALDRDPDAIAGGYGLVSAAAGRLTLIEAQFGGLDVEASSVGHARLDGVVLDIGVSSMQVDEAGRGFSFRNDGPLDMRMAQSGQSAADIVNEADEATIADILFHFGEERKSRHIAKAIIAARAEKRIETTAQLSDIVSKVIWPRPGQMHPATRTFQALRIAVNDELGELVRALHAAERALLEGGVLSVVTFHSLEDRIVKQFFSARSGKSTGSRFQPAVTAEAATFDTRGKWPVVATETETRANPRARSAKLRSGIRTSAPAQAEIADIVALSQVPKSTGGRR